MYYSQNPDNPASSQDLLPLTTLGWFLTAQDGPGRARAIPDTDRPEPAASRRGGVGRRLLGELALRLMTMTGRRALGPARVTPASVVNVRPRPT